VRFSGETRDAVLGGNAEKFWSFRGVQASLLKSHGGRCV
jgi:hypothetical protein